MHDLIILARRTPHAARRTPHAARIARAMRVCVWLLGLVALLAALVSSPVKAQYVPIYVDPPAGINDVWNGESGSALGPYDYYNAEYNWYSGGEWLSGGVPPDGVDVLFPDTYKGALPRQRIRAEKDLALRSLWFEAGIWYTIEGGQLTLGTAHPKEKPQVDPYLLVVNSLDLKNTSEHTLEFEQFTIADAAHWEGVGKIENYSEGGLGIFVKGEIDLKHQHIQIGGMGATHFNGTLTGRGIIDVGLFGGEEAYQTQPHLILQGNNRDWNGALRVNQRGFAIVKADQALGSYAPVTTNPSKRVYDGGSLALRSHLGIPLNYTAPTAPNHPLQITGAGIIRREGTERIGALYNDGGWNTFGMRVEFTGDTLFGARGDREGGLFLRGRVYNTGAGDFIKVGPGLIALNNSAMGSGANSWTGDTVIRGGVLRINHANARASSSSIVFEGGYNGIYPGIQGTTDGTPSYGGILELGYTGSGTGGVHNFTLGTGPGQLRWTGSGGFSAYGADRTVSFSNENGFPLTFTWGVTPHFLKDGEALLLSSRYATHKVDYASGISLGGGVREFRVERGANNDARASLSGGVSLSKPTEAFIKTGRGLLEGMVLRDASAGTVIIREGALIPVLGLWPTAGAGVMLDGGVAGVSGEGTPATEPSRQEYLILGAVGGSHSVVRWFGSGGFAGYTEGGPAHIKLSITGGPNNTVPIPLTWGQTLYFVAADKELRFGHYTADATVDFQNHIILGAPSIYQEAGRTIRIERGSDLSRADVILSGGISSKLKQGDVKSLAIVGDGRIDFSSTLSLEYNKMSLLGHSTLDIRGAELRLNRQNGRIQNVGIIGISNNGTLYLDNRGTHDSETGGNESLDRIDDTTKITLSGGTLANRQSGVASKDLVEKVGEITVANGENSLVFSYSDSVQQVGLHASKLTRNQGGYGVLNIVSDVANALILDESATGLNISTAGGVGIIPWAPWGEDKWSRAVSFGQSHSIQALPDNSYKHGTQNTWNQSDNVRLHSAFGSSNQVLSANREINSLILYDRNININGKALTIHSGGLLSGGTGTRTMSSNLSSGGTLTTSGGRPLYIHTKSNLNITGNLKFSINGNLVKSSNGTLTLDSNVTHRVGNVYIHRGTLDLKRGTLLVSNRITVGDGGGNATLKLAPNRWDQITAPSGLPNITLNGTPYDPRGPEYGGDQAILQMGGNTKLHLGNLHIENRGTIDWVGGEVSKANILWIESLTFSGPDAQLFMRNWYEYEDILLVRKTNFSESYLPQIIFDGYQNYETTYRQWDNDYWQITPFRHLDVKPFPEPSTYGAILGALGLGVVVWRRRKQKKTPLRWGRWSVTTSI